MYNFRQDSQNIIECFCQCCTSRRIKPGKNHFHKILRPAARQTTAFAGKTALLCVLHCTCFLSVVYYACYGKMPVRCAGPAMRKRKRTMKIGFDNDKYLAMQSEHIRERIQKFDNKLYLEFGGKLFDDYHASRVLPGFQPDSKLQMLLQLKDQAEIVIVISAADIEKNKVRSDLGITYDVDVLRLIQSFTDKGLYVGSVVITHYSGQNTADVFKHKLESMGIKVYRHYTIDGYPGNVPLIVSDEGYGKNDYIETKRPLVVVTAPGPGSGKMATCLSQLYHENKRGVKAGYAKFETFPIWNIPLKHPVNLAYEAATADLNDVNMIDPFHLEAYGVTTVNYNRDIEIFPVLSAIFEGIYGENPYKSPTDMGVNMAGNCIIDDEACCEASRQEILRRYYQALNRVVKEDVGKEEVYKIELFLLYCLFYCLFYLFRYAMCQS